MTPNPPPKTKSPGAIWLKREADLEAALITATRMVRDLANGYQIRDLAQSPEEAMERLNELVPNHEVMPL